MQALRSHRQHTKMWSHILALRLAGHMPYKPRPGVAAQSGGQARKERPSIVRAFALSSATYPKSVTALWQNVGISVGQSTGS